MFVLLGLPRSCGCFFFKDAVCNFVIFILLQYHTPTASIVKALHSICACFYKLVEESKLFTVVLDSMSQILLVEFNRNLEQNINGSFFNEKKHLKSIVFCWMSYTLKLTLSTDSEKHGNN